jgi:hypothetical protein
MPSLDAQHRYARLRSYRVNLRREVERLTHLLAWGGGDAIDLRQACEARSAQLRASDREWYELKAALHMPPDRPPVRLR